ncbi:hypothetical protein [EBPR siphovirus 3]|nr:hypothetical protein [EBPR siphovirus 3]
MARKPRFDTFAKDLQLATAGIAPENINRELAKYAKSALADAIASREASSIYTRYVNVRGGAMVKDAPEEQVEAPGPILYIFSYWEPILQFARDALIRSSPALTNAYINSQVLMIGAQVVPWNAQIAADEEVRIVATVPYARKIEVGHMRMSVPDGVFERVGRKIRSQYGLVVDARFEMVHLPGGYVLKGRFSRGYKPFARTKLKRDTQAGQMVTYPSILLRMKDR